MRDAVIISFLFHLVIITSTMIGLPLFSHDKPTEMKIIPVEVINVGEITKLKSQQKKPEPVIRNKPKPKKKQPERKVEMPPDPPKLKSTMPLADAVAKVKKVKPRKIDKKLASATRAPKITPKSKPRRFNAGKLAALLDKREKQQPDLIEKLKDKDYGKQKIVSDIDIRQQTLSIIDSINKHIFDNNCWNVPAGAKGAEDLRVTVQFRLSPEGRIIGSPKVLEQARMNRPGQEYYRTAAESALRAVRKCAPYDFLPKAQYDLWRELEINFDPEYMLNG